MKTTIKKQTAKIGVAGSFHNQLMSNNSSIPKVGEGATEMLYTDRRCYDVVEVSKDGKTAKLEYLSATADKTKEGGHGHQNWILEKTGQFITVVWRHNAWRIKNKVIEFTEEYAKTIGNNFRQSEDYKLLYPNGGIVPELIEGKTELVTKYDKINILFGTKDYYYDWEF